MIAFAPVNIATNLPNTGSYSWNIGTGMVFNTESLGGGNSVFCGTGVICPTPIVPPGGGIGSGFLQGPGQYAITIKDTTSGLSATSNSFTITTSTDSTLILPPVTATTTASTTAQ
jgi:hypothetical protein